MQVLRRELKLKIDDFGTNKELDKTSVNITSCF